MADELKVVRVRTKETLCQPKVAQLVMRGATACGLQGGAVLAELARDITSDNIGLFVGWRNSRSIAVVVGLLPVSAFQLGPYVAMLYAAERCPQLLVDLGAHLRRWIKKAGFDEALTTNLDRFGHSDRAWFRAFAHFGTPSRIGSVARFAFTGY